MPSAPLDTRYQIETPEGIDLPLRPAGLVPRVLAFAFDLGLRAVVMGILLVWRHAENIGRLLRGQESKIGSKKDKTAPAAKPVSQKNMATGMRPNVMVAAWARAMGARARCSARRVGSRGFTAYGVRQVVSADLRTLLSPVHLPFRGVSLPTRARGR